MAAAGQRSALLASMLANLAGVGASLLFVYICKTLIDIATGNSGRDLAGWSLAMVATMAAQTLFSLLRTRLAAQTDIRIKNNLRMQLFSRLICAYHGSRGERHSGDITNRLEEDVRVVSECLSNSLPALLSATVQFIAAFCFLMALNNTLAWSVVGIMPLAIILSKIFFRKLRRLTRDIRDTDSLVQSHLQENLQHATLIQTLEQEGRASSGLDRLQSGLYDSVMRRTRFTIVSRTVISLAFAAGYATAFLWGVNGLLAGAVTFGTMTAFLQLVGQIQRPVLELSSYIPSAIHAAASADRLMEIEGDESCAASEPVHLGSPAGIRMEHVSFAYPDGTRKVIDDFSHDFLPGSRTAIVGETGAGKSTLIRLILALPPERKHRHLWPPKFRRSVCSHALQPHLRAPGQLPSQRHRPRQPAARRPRSRRGRDEGGPPHSGCRLRVPASRRPRHPLFRERRRPQRRPGTENRHSPCAAEARKHPAARRIQFLARP